MAEAVLRAFKFKSLRYDYDDGVPKVKILNSSINAQFGCPREGGEPRGAVRIKFQLDTPNSTYLSFRGEATAFFEFTQLDEELTNDLVERCCWPTAYEELRKRLQVIAETFGEIKNLNLRPFESLEEEKNEE